MLHFMNVCLGFLQNAIEGFTKNIVDMMKIEGLFESQGGPIIMTQVYFDPSW